MGIRYVPSWHDVLPKVALNIPVSEVTRTVDVYGRAAVFWASQRLDLDDLWWVVVREYFRFCYILIIQSQSHFDFCCEIVAHGAEAGCFR